MHRQIFHHMVALLRGQDFILDRHNRGHSVYIITKHRDYLIHLFPNLKWDGLIDDCGRSLDTLYEQIGLVRRNELVNTISIDGRENDVLAVVEMRITSGEPSPQCKSTGSTSIPSQMSRLLGAADVLFTGSFYGHAKHCEISTKNRKRTSFKECFLQHALKPDEEYATTYLDTAHQIMLLPIVPPTSRKNKIYEKRNHLTMQSVALIQASRKTQQRLSEDAQSMSIAECGGLGIWRLDLLDPNMTIARSDGTHYSCILKPHFIRTNPDQCRNKWGALVTRILLALVEAIKANC
jgi:hypothetical protein